MNKEIWILRIDFYLQLILFILLFANLLINQNYVLELLIAIGCVQAASILYHCLLRRTKFSKLRSIHYGATVAVLSILFLIYLSQNVYDVGIEEFSLILLMLVALSTCVLGLLYFIETWNELFIAKEKLKH